MQVKGGATSLRREFNAIKLAIVDHKRADIELLIRGHEILARTDRTTEMILFDRIKERFLQILNSQTEEDRLLASQLNVDRTLVALVAAGHSLAESLSSLNDLLDSL